MPIILSSDELLNIAINIERSGVAFYDIMGKTTENTITRDVFENLANMEREHIQIFQSMLSDVNKVRPLTTYSEEYPDYIQSLVDNTVFTDDLISSEMATHADNDIQALELAIGAEKDSILFYYEMKEIMPKRRHKMINKIITEEKLHFRNLSELKRKLTAS